MEAAELQESNYFWIDGKRSIPATTVKDAGADSQVNF